MSRFRVGAAAGLAIAVMFLAGCTGGTQSEVQPSDGPSSTAAATPLAVPELIAARGVTPAAIDRPLRVGHLQGAGSRVLAEVYARALAEAGYEVELTVPGPAGTFVQALEQGQVDIVPVPVGPLTDTLFGQANGPGAVRAVTRDVETTRAAANALAVERGIVVLEATTGFQTPVFAVTTAFAESTGLPMRDLSTLSLYSRIVRPVRLAADSTCLDVSYCWPFLNDVYQMRFKEFVELPPDGGATKSALVDGSAEIGLFTADDAGLRTSNLRILEQDIQRPFMTNIVPAVRMEIATPERTRVLDEVSATVGTAELEQLIADYNRRIDPVGKVAGDYLSAKGLGEGLFDGPLDVVDVRIQPDDVSQSLASATALTTPRPGDPLRLRYTSIFDLEFAARVYAAALEDAGIDVEIGDPAPAEEVLALLASGEAQFAPVRLNTAASIMQEDAYGPLTVPITTRDPQTLASRARELAAPLGIEILEPSSANVGSAFVVSKAYRALTGVDTLSDLVRASQAVPVVFGGPPDCTQVSWCEPLLRDVYGVRLARFLPLDFGGGLTRYSVDVGDVDIAWLSANDGGIPMLGLTPLRDDLGREPVNPITPVMSEGSVTPEIAAVVDKVSAALTAEAVQEANLRVEFERESMRRVVDDFLRANGLD
jgi:osmoprotectant transport system substrate-binding protein